MKIIDAIAFHQTSVTKVIFVLRVMIKEWSLSPSFGKFTEI